ncbi:MAG: Uma2 family endonuclease [Bryobacteraceae bacterium]|nr:Uma2 family endonuclease [Bryobacteraceae bacterium]
MSAAFLGLTGKDWTRDEVESLESAGHLAGCRFELIEGELIDKMGQNPPHATLVHILMILLAEVFGLRRVRMQLPAEAARNERQRSVPEPDVMVTRDDLRTYATRHPEAADVLLIAEVADTSLTIDTTVKARLYARAEYREYWIVDINARHLLVFRQPVDGSYTLRTVCRPGDTISPLAAPEASIAVNDLFPPPL